MSWVCGALLPAVLLCLSPLDAAFPWGLRSSPCPGELPELALLSCDPALVPVPPALENW